MGLDLTPSVFEPYIPEYGGNRARYLAGTEPNPTIVRIRLPTWGEVRRQQQAAGTPEEIQAAFEVYMGEHIGPIVNLTLGGLPIRTGPELMAQGKAIDYNFLNELNRALGNREALEPGLAKNCGPRPGSAGSPPRSDGSVETAGAADSTSSPSATATEIPVAKSQ